MKLYYYEYETTVFNSFSNPDYELVQGYLQESPIGLLQFFDEDEFNTWNNIDDFNISIEKYFPKNFKIQELK